MPARLHCKQTNNTTKERRKCFGYYFNSVLVLAGFPDRLMWLDTYNAAGIVRRCQRTREVSTGPGGLHPHCKDKTWPLASSGQACNLIQP